MSPDDTRSYTVISVVPPEREKAPVLCVYELLLAGECTSVTSPLELRTTSVAQVCVGLPDGSVFVTTDEIACIVSSKYCVRYVWSGRLSMVLLAHPVS